MKRSINCSIYKKDEVMSKDLKEEVGEIIRDTTHNLVVNEKNELDNEIYRNSLKYFLWTIEGARNEAYLDGIPDPSDSTKFISAAKFYSLDKATQNRLRKKCREKRNKAKGRALDDPRGNPITTVGIGANIESEKVKKKFDKLLGKPGLMDKVYYGKENIEDAQVDILLEECLKERNIKLHDLYGEDWNKLKVNEKIAISSLYFNLPTLVDESTRFMQHIKNYIKTNDPKYLKQAVDEVVNKSNRENHPGIQNRRNAEGALLASYKSPTYTKPNEYPDSVKIKVAKINKTIIPLQNGKVPIKGMNSEYFIWRTKMDYKVRNDHALFEGRIFRKDNPPGYMPGKQHNCRCHIEEVPDYIIVDDEVARKKAFDRYLRKGITHPILFIK